MTHREKGENRKSTVHVQVITCLFKLEDLDKKLNCFFKYHRKNLYDFLTLLTILKGISRNRVIASFVSLKSRIARMVTTW